MSPRTFGVPEAVQRYLLEQISAEPEVLARLREETAQLPAGGMQIAPEQGRFMQWLVTLLGARRCVEVGVFTGYSSLSVGLALPEDGRVVCCDVSDEWTQIARRYWAEAGIAHKFELRLGPGLATLDALLGEGGRASYDFAFIDADKDNYRGYYERCLELLRVGGVLAVDNALWSGKVADPSVTDRDTVAIRELNAHAVRDPRVSTSLLPLGDGVLLARKL